MRVTFYLPEETDIEPLKRVDPDADAQPLQRGDRAWVLQTYLRLRRAGYPAELSMEPPSEGILVFHNKHRFMLSRLARRLEGLVLVGTRADSSEAAIADFEVLQNGRFESAPRRTFIPSWPQPALLPRDLSRGDRIEVVAFKGFSANIHPDLLGERWRDGLAALGVRFEVHAGPYAGTRTDETNLGWHDYTNVDLTVAIRPGHGRHTSKPATKLYNAWHAGVPALLGREYAYRELRRSPLDYIEVHDWREALLGVKRLVNEPSLYRAMVEHGHQRGGEFSHEAIVARWVELLYETIPNWASSPEGQRLRRTPLRLRAFARRLTRVLALRPAH